MKLVHHVLDIDAPAATIWSALTEARGLGSWWCTQVQAPSANVGAHLVFTLAPGAKPEFEITASEPNAELEWRVVGGLDVWSTTTIRFVLVPLDDGRTKLRFWHDYGVDVDDDTYGDVSFNWAYYLESLRLLCTTGTGKPFGPAVAA